MANRLHGVRLKLQRAEDHLVVLHDAVQRFIECNVQRIPGKFDLQGCKYVFRGHVSTTSLDDRWSTVIGDVVHNLHAALDYLVCQLSIANPSSADGGCEKTAFPIFAAESRYDTDAPKRIKNVAAGAQAAIKALQPFNGGASSADVDRHPLMMLYHLEQWDKHRMLHTTAIVSSVRIKGWPSDVKVPEPIDFMAAEDKAIYALCPVPDTFPVGYAKMDVYLEVTPQVVFDPGGPAPRENVLQVLRGAKRYIIDSVIPAVEPFLS